VRSSRGEESVALHTEGKRHPETIKRRRSRMKRV
jgi:hypothetical protein